MIITDDNGRPFVAPEPPPRDAPIDDVIAYLRASAAHNDRVSTMAGRAFDEAFRRQTSAVPSRSCHSTRRPKRSASRS